MKKRKKCKYCGSEFVCWNWIYSPFFRTWWHNLSWRPFGKILWHNLKFWKFFDRWNGECWNCSSCQGTFFKVKYITNEDLHREFKYLPEHEVRDILHELSYLFENGYLWQEERFNQRLEIAKDAITKLLLEKYIQDRIEGKPYISDILKENENNEKK